MNKVKFVLFVAGISLALAFTLSCGGVDTDNQSSESGISSSSSRNNSSSSIVQSSSAVLKECDAVFNPDNKFCYDGVVYDKCGGKIYNPVTQGCLSGKVEEKCGSSLYKQATQFCYDNLIYAKCDGMEYSPAIYVCRNNVATPAKCGNESYNPLTQYCENGTVENRDFIDVRDGKKYKAIGIGTQVWMSENLNYEVTGSVCADEVPANCAKYGRLYDWKMAMALPDSCNNRWCFPPEKHRGICPSGWHLPSATEWGTLLGFVGESAGTKLKATDGWINNSIFYGNGTDYYGFAALPGGDGTSGLGTGSCGWWWTATEIKKEFYAYSRLIVGGTDVEGSESNKSGFHSVRCVKD